MDKGTQTHLTIVSLVPEYFCSEITVLLKNEQLQFGLFIFKLTFSEGDNAECISEQIIANQVAF